MTENEDQAAGIPEWGYWLDFSPAPDAIQHDFCGSHNISGANCPNCSKPLLRILSLLTADPALRPELSKTPVIHLLYCWTCSIPYDLFSYKLNLDGSVELIEVPSPQTDVVDFGPGGPYDGYTGAFQLQRICLQPQSANEYAQLRKSWAGDSDETEGALFEPRHQIGGYPFIYNPQKRHCPKCAGEMRMLASICNDATGNNAWRRDIPTNTFVDNGGVQMFFLFCPTCAIVSAAHSCD
jgi:hypothetical protein